MSAISAVARPGITPCPNARGHRSFFRPNQARVARVSACRRASSDAFRRGDKAGSLAGIGGDRRGTLSSFFSAILSKAVAASRINGIASGFGLSPCVAPFGGDRSAKSFRRYVQRNYPPAFLRVRNCGIQEETLLHTRSDAIWSSPRHFFCLPKFVILFPEQPFQHCPLSGQILKRRLSMVRLRWAAAEGWSSV